MLGMLLPHVVILINLVLPWPRWQPGHSFLHSLAGTGPKICESLNISRLGLHCQGTSTRTPHKSCREHEVVDGRFFSCWPCRMFPPVGCLPGNRAFRSWSGAHRHSLCFHAMAGSESCPFRNHRQNSRGARTDSSYDHFLSMVHSGGDTLSTVWAWAFGSVPSLVDLATIHCIYRPLSNWSALWRNAHYVSFPGFNQETRPSCKKFQVASLRLSFICCVGYDRVSVSVAVAVPPHVSAA